MRNETRSAAAKASTRSGAAAKPNSFDSRRAALVERIAASFLTRGVAEVPLRELARELGTSDRMLLYYFNDKAELVTAALSTISSRLSEALHGALPSGRLSPARLLRQVTTLLASRTIKPYMNVWADLVAHGSRGEQPYRAFMSASATGWLQRIEARLDVPEGAARRRVAAALLTIAEGSRMLEDALPGCTCDTLEIFVAGLEAKR